MPIPTPTYEKALDLKHKKAALIVAAVSVASVAAVCWPLPITTY